MVTVIPMWRGKKVPSRNLCDVDFIHGEPITDAGVIVRDEILSVQRAHPLHLLRRWPSYSYSCHTRLSPKVLSPLQGTKSRDMIANAQDTTRIQNGNKNEMCQRCKIFTYESGNFSLEALLEIRRFRNFYTAVKNTDIQQRAHAGRQPHPTSFTGFLSGMKALLSYFTLLLCRVAEFPVKSQQQDLLHAISVRSTSQP